MSGGVDSSVAAALLKKQGYFVAGAYMKNFSEESWAGVLSADCPWQQDVADAKAVCDKLGIEFRSFNFEREYADKVIEYFFAEYAAGRTPNPDVMCNKEIKFGLFLQKALGLGYDYIATGHYARIRPKPSLRGVPAPSRDDAAIPSSMGLLRSARNDRLEFELLKGMDSKKDQSYFLYTLTQDQLSHTLFSIGEYTKPEVRKLAREFGLPNAEKKDSQGVCFVGHINLREFLKQRIPERVGEIVDPSGRVIGTHPGAWYYTLGQREGLGIGGTGPYYVAEKDVVQNKLTVIPLPSSPKLGEDKGGVLYSKQISLRDIHWIGTAPELPFSCTARIRYQQPDQKCIIQYPPRPLRERMSRAIVEGQVRGLRVHFSSPQFAPAPGQSVVFYSGDTCLGGGIID